MPKNEVERKNLYALLSDLQALKVVLLFFFFCPFIKHFMITLKTNK